MNLPVLVKISVYGTSTPLHFSWKGSQLFFPCSLKGYMDIMDKAAKLLLEEISWHSGEYFDVEAMVQAMTMSVIGQTAFG